MGFSAVVILSVDGSILSVIMVIIYTNLPPIAMGQIIVINMVLFMGIMRRMVQRKLNPISVSEPPTDQL